MRLCTFRDQTGARAGVVEQRDGEYVVADVTSAANEIPRMMMFLLGGGEDVLSSVNKALQRARRIPLDQVELLPPIPRPGKFLGIGLNYRDHAKEMGMELPEFPSTFGKQTNSIIGPYAEIWKTHLSDTLDYEGELGIVIGTRCRHVPSARAHRVIAGYTVVNDVTVREWMQKSPPPTLAKSFDNTSPMGPWIVTPEEVDDPTNLGIQTFVNGHLRQDSNTGQMIFSVYDIVEKLTQSMTLEAGDVITTGTPPGVGHGMKPKKYLQAGDTVKVEIEFIGHVENKVVDEPAEAATDLAGRRRKGRIGVMDE